MSKELEALEVIKNIELSHIEQEEDEDFDGNWVYDTVEVNDGLVKDNYPEQIDIINQALQRLEQIDNANPSEALVYLDAFIEENNNDIKNRNNTGYDIDTQAKWVKYLEHKSFMLSTIKQYILKSQEQEDRAKAFDLINEKRVDIKTLHWAYPSVEAYNVWVREHKDSFPREELTKEEFEFIGRLAGAK